MRTRCEWWSAALGLSLLVSCGGKASSDAERPAGAPASGGSTGGGNATGSEGGSDLDPTGAGGDSGGVGAEAGRGASAGAFLTGGADGVGASVPVGGDQGLGGSLPTGGASGGAAETSGSGPAGGDGGAIGAGRGGATSSCANPVLENGFVLCDGPWLHRESVETCPSTLPREVSYCPPTSGTCATDLDCTEQPNGFCASDRGGPCRCSYGCRSDDDCGTGMLCLCEDPVGRCVPTACTTDADCGSDSLCASYDGVLCGGFAGFACVSTADACTNRSDCSPSYLSCRLDASGARTCQPCAVP
jgi:hypothetical protein